MQESKFYKQMKPSNENSQKILHYLKTLLTKSLLTAIITLLLLIAFKLNPTFKTTFYQKVYQESFPFATVKEAYQSYFGKDLISQKIETTQQVFKEKLTYSKKNLYHDGVRLTVSNQYMIPNLNSGIVVYIGQKEHYQNTIIVQQMNGMDTWYGNVENVNVKLYDYVEKGSLLGQVKDTTLYLAFQQNGNFLDYKDYVE